MILLDVSARMVCAEKGCEKHQSVQLMLNTMGCFQFKPSEEGWQVLHKPGEVGPYVCRCPEHQLRITHEAKLQVGPSGPRVKLAEH